MKQFLLIVVGEFKSRVNVKELLITLRKQIQKKRVWTCANRFLDVVGSHFESHPHHVYSSKIVQLLMNRVKLAPVGKEDVADQAKVGCIVQKNKKLKS